MKYYFYRPRSTTSFFLTLLIKSNDQTNSSSPTMSTSVVFYSSVFNSLYKSTGPKCQYFVLSVDNFLYSSER